MSNRLAESPRWLGHRVDRVGALAALVFAAILFPLRFFTDELFIQVIPVLIAVASALYLVIDHAGNTPFEYQHWHVSHLASRSLGGITVLGIGTLGLVATMTGGRTLPFVGLATVVAGLIFVQILFVRDETLQPASLVIQVVALAVVVRFGALATTPGLVGVDSWTHVTTYAQAIRDTGSLSAIADVKYFAAPLYHLLAVIAADAFGTSLRTAIYATLGLVVPISTVLVYLTANSFLPARWSLFAMAVYAVGDHVVRWGIHLIPTSMGLVFFLVVVYAITMLFFVDREGPLYALTALFGLAVVLTHQVSAFITLVFLGAALLAQWLVWAASAHTTAGSRATTDRTTNVTPLFFIVCGLTVINWALTPYGSGTFIGTMGGSLQRALSSSAGFLDLVGSTPLDVAGIQSLVTTVPTWIQFVDSLGFFLLLTGVLLGSLTLVRSDYFSQLSLTYVIAAGGMLVVTLGLPLFGLNLLIPGRWYAFMYVPMAIVAAIGVRYLMVHLSTRGVVVGILLLAFIFPGAMFVSHKATPGDPVFAQDYPRYSYTSSELAAVETIDDIHPESGPTIRTDHPYRTLFTRWQGQPAKGVELSSTGTVSADASVYRQYQSDGASSVRYEDRWVEAHLDRETVCGDSSAVLYTNGDVTYCRSLPAV